MAMLTSQRWFWILAAPHMLCRGPNGLGILAHALGCSRKHTGFVRPAVALLVRLESQHTLDCHLGRPCKCSCLVESEIVVAPMAIKHRYNACGPLCG